MNYFSDRWMREQWLVRGDGPKVLSVAALSMCVLGLMFYAHFKIDALVADSKALQITVALLGCAGAVGTLLLSVSMWYFLIRVDRSPRWIKYISFFVLLFGLIYGGLVYFVLVYLPQVYSMRRESLGNDV